MTEVFLKIINMSISASWLVLAVLALRFCLKKAPKWVNVVLWGIVAARLMFPFSIESALSLIPSAETISPEIMMDRTPELATGIPALNNAVNPIITETFTPSVMNSANPLQIWIPIAALVWILGMAVMAVYTAASFFRLSRQVRRAVCLRDNIYRCEQVPSPFVLGIRRPRIYLPYGMEESDMTHVIAHEQTHIRRRDHWWKPLGFLLLTVHWFNPLMWVAYILLCRDIELACDEKVIQELGRDQRADYSQALLTCSVNRKMIAACPLAFGEVGVRERVKNVLSYKKPAFWIIVIAVILCVVMAVCFLTNPAPSRKFAMAGDNVADLDPQWITEQVRQITKVPTGGLCAVPGYSLTLTDDFNWAEEGAIQFWYSSNIPRLDVSAQLRLYYEEDQFYVTRPKSWEDSDIECFLETYLEALKYMPQEQIRALAPDADRYIVNLVDTKVDGRGPDRCERAITYTPYGVGNMYSWSVHLELLPLYARDDGYHGMGDEAIHLFYGKENEETPRAVTRWFDNLGDDSDHHITEAEIQLDAFPGVTFRYNYGDITAKDEAGERALIMGMPIWNAYFADLNSDGAPEICATVSYGSGLIDTHVVVYDYANQKEYTLWERGVYDYFLRQDENGLWCDKHPYADYTTVQERGALMLVDTGGDEGQKLEFIPQAIYQPGATRFIVDIIDRTVTENLPTDEALELFYEDAENEYYFPSIKSHYVMVTYNNGNSEDIKTALSEGRATIADLDTYGITYYVEPKVDIVLRDLLPADSDTVTQVELTNLHNGESTRITDATAIGEILDFARTVTGMDLGSSKGYYGGCYSLKLTRGEEELLHLAFGDDDTLLYGYAEGDTYPTRYGLNNTSTVEVTKFLRQFDSSFPPVAEFMVETVDALRGIFGSFLYVPINGATYRYEWEKAGTPLWADELLDTFTVKDAVWSVYSMKNYPDKSKVLLVSDTDSAWVCAYNAVRAAADDALVQAWQAGYVIAEDDVLTGGAEVWNAFCDAALSGKPVSVVVAKYYAHTPDGAANGGYGPYPMLELYELTYDGSVYTIRRRSDGKTQTYAYLMTYTVSGTPEMTTQAHVNIDTFVLTNDDTVTYDQLVQGMISSVSGDYIDHFRLFKHTR